MNRNLLLVITVLAIIVIQSGMVSATNTFERLTWGSSSSTPVQTITQSIYGDVTCSLEERAYFTGTTSSSYYINFQHYSPFDTVQVIGTTPSVSNVTCYPLGYISGITDTNNSLYESKVEFTHGATYSNTAYAKSILTCETEENIVTVGTNGEFDGNGYLSNVFRTSKSGSTYSPWTTVKSNIYTNNIFPFGDNYIEMMEADEDGDCPSNTYSSSGSGSWANTYFNYDCVIEFLPFNSGNTGDVNFRILSPDASVTGVSPISASEIGYFPLDNPSGEYQVLYTSGNYFISGSTGFSSINIDENESLTPERDYALYMMYCGSSNAGGHPDYGTFTYTHSNANVTFSVYTPDWNCTDWSDCESGSQWRTCVDLNGIATTKTEYQSCFEFAEESVFLGFSDYTEEDVWYCSEASIFGGCSMNSELKTRRYPDDWSVSVVERTDSVTSRTGKMSDFVDMSTSVYYEPDEGITESSLKMWYLPRKSWLPVYNQSGYDQVTCNETTEGQVPVVYRDDINETFWISRNITALSPYMTLSYRVRKCTESEVQSTGGWGCFIIGQTKGCNSTGIDLYTWDGCPQTPRSTIGVIFREIGGDYLLDYAREVTANNFEEGYVEEYINDLNISSIYELDFGVPPLNGLQDPYSYCVYIDDVNINFRETAVTCESRCEDDYDGDGVNDYTKVEATQLSESACTISIITAHPDCVPADARDEAEDHEDFCVGTTLYTYNNETFEYEIIEDSDYCIEEYQQEQQLEESTSAIGIFDDYGITGYLTDSGFGFAIIFLTPIFWVFIIALTIGGIVAYYSESFELGLSGFMGILILASMPQFGIFPFWFIIVFIIIGGVVFARFITRAFSKGR